MSIQGHILELHVTGCRKLLDTEFLSRQDPYVVIEYANTKLRTRTCTDGGRNPSFYDKFRVPLVEGLRDLNVAVWNSNTVSSDDFIGSCRVQLHKVLTCGYDDSSWPLQTRLMKSAGEVDFIMYFDVSAMNSKMGKNDAKPSACSVPPMSSAASPPSYPAPSAYPAVSPHQAYPAPSHAPRPPPQQLCPQHSAYPPAAYPPQPYGQPSYPPQPYGQPYPPPQAAQSPYPPAPYPEAYPPPPY